MPASAEQHCVKMVDYGRATVMAVRSRCIGGTALQMIGHVKCSGWTPAPAGVLPEQTAGWSAATRRAAGCRVGRVAVVPRCAASTMAELSTTWSASASPTSPRVAPVAPADGRVLLNHTSLVAACAATVRHDSVHSWRCITSSEAAHGGVGHCMDGGALPRAVQG